MPHAWPSALRDGSAPLGGAGLVEEPLIVWPKARLKKERTAEAEIEGDEEEDEDVVPTVTLWPFALLETGPGVAVAVSDQLTGPAMVDTLDLTFDDDDTAPRPAVSLFYAPDGAGAGNGLSIDPTTLGTQIFSRRSTQVEGGGSEYQSLRGVPKFDLGSGAMPRTHRLAFPITSKTFYLKLAMETTAVAAHRCAGYVRVVGGLTRAQLRVRL